MSLDFRVRVRSAESDGPTWSAACMRRTRAGMAAGMENRDTLLASLPVVRMRRQSTAFSTAGPCTAMWRIVPWTYRFGDLGSGCVLPGSKIPRQNACGLSLDKYGGKLPLLGVVLPCKPTAPAGGHASQGATRLLQSSSRL